MITKRHIFETALIFLLGLILRLAMLYQVTSSGRTPLQISPQAIEYVLLGRAILQGDWANNYFVARPPLMPMLVAGVFGVAGHSEMAVALVNALLGAATASLAFFYAATLSGDMRVARVAGLLVAIDPASIANSINLQAETLATFFLVLGAWQFARLVQRPAAREAALAGLWFGLAALTRPTTVYLFAVGLPVFVFLFKAWRRLYLWFVIVPVLLLVSWCARNWYFIGEFTYATVSDFNLLFYRAVSVERWAEGGKSDELIRREFAQEIERRLGNEVPLDQIDPGYFWMNFAPEDGRRVRIMRAMALEVYLAHPVWYVATIPIGLYRMFAYTEAFGDPFVPEMLFNMLLYGLAGVGVILCWRRKLVSTLALNGLWIGYMTAATMISQTSGMDTRMRVSITFAIAMLAAVAIVWVWERYAGRAGTGAGLWTGRVSASGSQNEKDDP